MDELLKLFPQELRGAGICVSLLHPGFNKTDMTKKYEHIWEVRKAHSFDIRVVRDDWKC